MAERLQPLSTVSPGCNELLSVVSVAPLMAAAAHVSVEEVVVARKLSPTFQPDVPSLTNTRCFDAKSIVTGEPDAAIAADETVNWWLVESHVPPRA